MDLALWRDISIVWLSIFCFIGQLIPLVIAYFAVRGMSRALRGTAHVLHLAQDYSSRTRLYTNQTADRIVQPVARVRSQGARFEAVWKSLWRNSS